MKIYFQHMVFTIFYHSFNTPDVLLCVHEAMLKYMHLAGSGLVKSVLQLLIDGNKHNKCVK